MRVGCGPPGPTVAPPSVVPVVVPPSVVVPVVPGVPVVVPVAMVAMVAMMVPVRLVVAVVAGVVAGVVVPGGAAGRGPHHRDGQGLADVDDLVRTEVVAASSSSVQAWKRTASSVAVSPGRTV